MKNSKIIVASLVAFLIATLVGGVAFSMTGSNVAATLAFGACLSYSFLMPAIGGGVLLTGVPTVEQIIKETTEKINAKQAELETAIKDRAKASDIEGLKLQIDTLKEAGIKQGEIIEAMKNAKNDEPKTFHQTIVDHLKAGADTIKQIAKGSKGVRFETEIKAAGSVTRAEVATNTIGERLAEIGQKPTRKMVMESLFNSGTTSAKTIYFTDQETVSRNADNVAEGAAYPSLSEINWKERSINIEKVGDLMKVTRESLDDIDFIASEVRNFLMANVDLQVDRQLLLGSGVSPELKGLDVTAGAFAAGGYAAKVKNPNLYGLVTVIAAQIAETGQGLYMPNYAVLNPKDATLLKLQKDANDQYIIPPFTTESGMVISGVRVVESTLVSAGAMFVGDFAKGTVYNRQGLTLEMAMENEDDFKKDLVSIKASRRMALLIRNLHANAFVKCADISAALTAIAKP